MQKTQSILHRLQKEGVRALEVADVVEGFGVDAAPFINKVSNYYNDPFPVFVMKIGNLKTLAERFMQIQAANGLPINQELSASDAEAVEALLNEERMRAHSPARRFGIELQVGEETVGLVFEAIKTITSNTFVPYQPSEWSDSRIMDCAAFRVFYLIKGEKSPKIQLDSSCVFQSIPEDIKTGKNTLTLSELSSELVKLTRVPSRYEHQTAIDPTDIFFKTRNRGDTLLKIMDGLIDGAFTFLWVLEREPKLIKSDVEDFSQENKLRRGRSLTPYSPIRVMDIDQEELRRLEHQRASEIEHALATKGGYKIPGLVLVSKHTRPSSGKIVDAYARCEDEIVRTMATEFLRSESYEDLAELVRDFGNRTTQGQFGLSILYTPRMV